MHSRTTRREIGVAAAGGRGSHRATGLWRGLLAVALLAPTLISAQTSPTNFNLSVEEAAATDIDGVPGYGANYGTGSSYDLRFGRVDPTTAAQTPIIESFEVGTNLFIQVPRPVPTPYDRVIVNRRVTSTVDNLNKFTGFFSNNGLVGGVPDGSEVFFQSEYVTTLEEIINSYDIDRGADNVFANEASVATRNNVQRIDLIIDDPLVVGTGALPRTGILILERGGNDQLTLAAITGLDPDTGEVSSLGPLVKTAGPLTNTWGPTGVNRSTTVFQNDNSATGFQDIRPDQNLSAQSISGSYVSLADLGIAAGQPMYGLALFGNDVVDTMDLVGLSDVPLDTDGTANGGLDMMGGGGFFFSSELELDKQANVATYAEVGDEIEYSFVLSNNGVLTLTDVQVIDPMLGGVIACTPSTLLAGETADCGPVTYIVTQADIDAGQIVNVAEGTGLDPDDEPLFAIDNETVTGPPRVPGLEVEKLLTDAPDPVFAGDLIEFTISATNTGNITLTDVVVTDLLLTPDTITCPTVAPGESCDLVGTYELTQADIDAGEFLNLATAEAPDPLDPDGPPLEDEDELITPLPAVPDLVLEKVITGGDPYTNVGDVIDYQLTATNTGNVTLSNVEINDPDIASLACTPTQPAVLAPTESLVCTGSYTVDQGDIDAGSFTNLATVEGEGPGGEPAVDEDEATADGPPADPSLIVSKELTDAPAPITVGSVLEYTVTATNTGNVTLSNVVVSDALISPDSITCPSVAPGGTCVLVGTYSVTQADIDNGEILNIGTAEAPDPTDPGGPPVSDDDDVTTPLPQDPALALDKIITAGNPYAAVGDVISYQLTATNTGNVTLSNVEINDPDIASLACTPTQPAVLAPTESLVCTGSYTVDQGDIDAGSFTNTATASGEGPGGQSVGDTDDATADGPAGAPGLSVTKALTDAPDPIEVGSVLEYTVTATNIGNVTLSNVVVSDPLITPDSVTCPTLAVGDDCVLVGSYTVTQDDMDAGEILNTGAAEAPDPNDPDGPPIGDEDDVTIPLPQDPGLTLEKLLTDAPDPIEVGSVLEYTVTATNTGNITLSNVVVSDTMIVPDSITCATLEVGDECVLVGTYTVTQDDINAGEIVNTGSVEAPDPTDPDGPPLVDEDEMTTPLEQTPALAIEKALSDAPDPISAGSVLTYTVTATNTGNVTLNNVVVSDDLIDPSSISCPVVTVGDSCVLTGTYTVTQDDVEAGQIINTGSAVSDETPTPIEDELTTPLDQNPAIELEKVIIDGSPYAAVGDVIEYQLTATNTGDVTLFQVSIADPGATIDSCVPAQLVDLAPGETLVCEATYTVEQGDIDAGSYVNTATVTATDPNDEPVSDTDTATADGPEPAPALSLVKVLQDAPEPIVEGSVVTYAITATNSGNVTLSNVVVEDNMITPDSVVCAVLEIGETCVLVGTYVVQASDIANGALVNVATAVGDGPDNEPVPEVTDTVTTFLREPLAVPLGTRWSILMMTLLLLFAGLMAGSFGPRKH